MEKAPVCVAAPPSKSLTHRKLIAASLAKGRTHLSHVLECDDTLRTIEVLRKVGVAMDRTGPGEYTIVGLGGPPRAKDKNPVLCDMGDSGTSGRLLTALLAAGYGTFTVYGSSRLQERPMAGLLETLAVLGANFHFQKKSGCLPLVCAAHGLSQEEGSWLPVRADHSSQFLSGLLLAAPLIKNGLRLKLAGERVASWPYVHLTLQTMEDSGCRVFVTTSRNGDWEETDWRELRMDDKSFQPDTIRFRVEGGAYRPLTGCAATVEGDYSAASCLLAAGAIGRVPVTVTNLHRDSLQGDKAFLDMLAAMGASVNWNADTVTVGPGQLHGITRDMRHCPDLVPTVAVLACLAEGRTILEGVENLRLKESDRIQAVTEELSKTGCRIDISHDAMVIVPPKAIPEGPLLFSSHDDHRMAMSLALLELAYPGAPRIVLDNPGCVGKSFPSFWKVWRAICPASSITPGEPL